jgi:hypothetical protein
MFGRKILTENMDESSFHVREPKLEVTKREAKQFHWVLRFITRSRLEQSLSQTLKIQIIRNF